MADANDCNSPKKLLLQLPDSRPTCRISPQLQAFSDRIRSSLNRQSESTEESGGIGTIENQLLTSEKSKPLAFQKGNTLSGTKDQIDRSTKYDPSSSTSSTSSELPVKMKRSQPTTTNCPKKIKKTVVWMRSSCHISRRGAFRCIERNVPTMVFDLPQDSQGTDEQVVHPEGSSDDRSGYPE